MAQVNQDYYLSDWIAPENLPGRIDRALQYLINEWQSLPGLSEEWDQWDEHDRFDFYIEWPLKDDALHSLQQWDAQGLLSPEQCERYAELQRLMEQNAPILERLLAA